MDKLSEFLSQHPEGADSERIAREVLGLKGAVGPVAEKVVRAAAEVDPRIIQADGDLWILSAKPVEQSLKDVMLVGVATHTQENGTLDVVVSKFSFEGERQLETFTIPPVRSEDSLSETSKLLAFVAGATPAGFGLARQRGQINRTGRMHLGRSVLGEGLCLAKMARRCFPEQKIRTCSDIASALGLQYVSSEGLEEACRSQVDLLLGLLERFQTRNLSTITAVQEDLQPTVTAVDFEAFAFDEDYLDELPTTPGVYVMRDREGCVIYVGKSVHLRDRVKTYFAKRSEREDKTLKILERIWTVEVLEVGSELEALILEAKLIQKTRPEFNKQVEVHERSTERQASPYLLILPSADPDSVELFGMRSDHPIVQVRVRKDLEDWAAAWTHLQAFVENGADGVAEADDVEQAAQHILEGWVVRQKETVNLIDVDDAGNSENLKRLLSTHIRAADDDAWEKVWRI